MRVNDVLRDKSWLIEQSAFPLLLARVLAHKSCPTAKEFAKSHRRRLEEAKAAPTRAVQGLGGDDAEEVRLASESPSTKSIRAVSGKVGVVGVHGPISQRLTPEAEKAGGTSLEEVQYAFDALLADNSVEAIVLHFDSPGGGIYGLEELSDRIFAARSEKKCYAMVDSMACSAAYWLASACGTLVCTPGGDVGSVGVYCVHVDESKQLEAEGVKLTVVKAGKFKAEMASCEPLSDAARDHLQEVVDEDYGKFCKALSRNRNCSVADVRNNFGQGRAVSADKALAAGMIDRVMSFSDLMAKLLGKKAEGGNSGRRASEQAKSQVEAMRLRHEHQKQRAGA